MGNAADDRLTEREKVPEAIAKGFVGESCRECGNFTLRPNGEGNTLQCDTCDNKQAPQNQ